ncbi:ribosomal RNA processing protein 36 homolog [Harmonia axyridis]|uniref:ribosomal RNA processing protein 36 homolog n=1 Tax=Harmonia axyridis TaxID=115357 RepID=UPI001E279688|nr:ribosomal RNA processing protein 36 homolog [Harmonia axyridis]
MDSDNSGSESSNESELSVESEDIQELRDEDSNRAKIRKQLSQMTYEDIQKLKEKIGSKVYNNVVLGIKTSKPKTNFKRANKNRPREMSSKIRPREISSKKSTPNRAPKKQIMPRDPRFDSMCGEYDEKSFRENFKFITNMRRNEKKQLEKELKDTEDPERVKQIKLLVQRLGNQIREAEKREQLQLEKLEQSKEMKEKLEMGEKPLYKKKSEKKIEELLHKYDDLKKSNKLQKHIERRQKKGC